jgi:AcrR family transcriptional regulator
MSTLPHSTRDRIVKAAAKLFYGGGIQTVSMDRVAEKAGVTKRTLYYHFRSKDDLIAASLEIRDQPNLALFKRWFAETEGDTAAKVEGVFRHLAAAAKHPKWKGCGFLRTSVELFDLPGHPAIVVGRAHKRRVEDWLCETLVEMGAGVRGRQLARQVLLLLDGAFAVVLLHRDTSYLNTAGEAAAKLIRCDERLFASGKRIRAHTALVART